MYYDIMKSGESVLEVRERERERERAELTRHLVRKRRQSLSNLDVTRSFGLFALLRKRKKAFIYQVAVVSYYICHYFIIKSVYRSNSKLVSEFHDTSHYCLLVRDKSCLFCYCNVKIE